MQIIVWKYHDYYYFDAVYRFFKKMVEIGPVHPKILHVFSFCHFHVDILLWEISCSITFVWKLFFSEALVFFNPGVNEKITRIFNLNPPPYIEAYKNRCPICTRIVFNTRKNVSDFFGSCRIYFPKRAENRLIWLD